MIAKQARNGVQQSPMYPVPAYPSGGQQQQPLFIIIPSSSGKSHKPHIVPASHYASSRSYTDHPQNQNLLQRRFLIRKTISQHQKKPSKVFLDKVKHKVDGIVGSPSNGLVVLSDRALANSPTLTSIKKSTKRQTVARTTGDEFPTTSLATTSPIQPDWITDQ